MSPSPAAPARLGQDGASSRALAAPPRSGAGDRRGGRGRRCCAGPRHRLVRRPSPPRRPALDRRRRPQRRGGVRREHGAARRGQAPGGRGAGRHPRRRSGIPRVSRSMPAIRQRRSPPRRTRATHPGCGRRSSAVAALLMDDDLAGAVEQVHALFRARSPAAGPALELVAFAAQSRARKGALAKVEAVLPRMQELPSSEPVVRSAVARVLATVALASARAGQPERSLQQARAALVLDETTPEAYLAVGEYQFQDNDLPGALDTWERGLRLNPGEPSLALRLERGRAEAERLGGLERVASEHFVVAFDGRADVPGSPGEPGGDGGRATAVSGRSSRATRTAPSRWCSIRTARSTRRATPPGRPRSTTGRFAFPPPERTPTPLRFRGHAVPRVRPCPVPPRHQREARARPGSTRALPRSPSCAAIPVRRCAAPPTCTSSRCARWRAASGASEITAPRTWPTSRRRHAVERIVERHGEDGVRALLAELSTGAPFAAAFERALGEDYADVRRSVRRRGCAADTSAAMDLELEGKAGPGERHHRRHRLGHRRRARRRGRRGGAQRQDRGAGRGGGASGPRRAIPRPGCAASPPTSARPKAAPGWCARSPRWTSW